MWKDALIDQEQRGDRNAIDAGEVAVPDQQRLPPHLEKRSAVDRLEQVQQVV